MNLLIKFIAVDDEEKITDNLSFVNEIVDKINESGLIKKLLVSFNEAKAGANPVKIIDDDENIFSIEFISEDMERTDSWNIIFLRQEQSALILVEFKNWLDTRKSEVPPESLIGKAIGYTLGQWDKLIRYIDYGFVPIDNNLVENAVRPFVIGRKNYLFHGSPTGADASASLYSIIETAKINGHEPFYYLYYLFSKLPFVKNDADYRALLPFNVSRKEIHSFAIENWLALDS